MRPCFVKSLVLYYCIAHGASNDCHRRFLDTVVSRLVRGSAGHFSVFQRTTNAAQPSFAETNINIYEAHAQTNPHCNGRVACFMVSALMICIHRHVVFFLGVGWRIILLAGISTKSAWWRSLMVAAGDRSEKCLSAYGATSVSIDRSRRINFSLANMTSSVTRCKRIRNLSEKMGLDEKLNDRAYMRETRQGPTLGEMKAALVPLLRFADWVYIDLLPRGTGKRQPKVAPTDLERRAAVIADTRAPSRVLVYGLEQLGLSGVDILAALGALARKGVGVYDVMRQREIPPGTGAEDLAVLIAEAETALRRGRLQKANQKREELRAAGTKVRSGPRPGFGALPKETQDALLRSWQEELDASPRDLITRHRLKVTERTLHRWMGPRGSRPGRRGKKPS